MHDYLPLRKVYNPHCQHQTLPSVFFPPHPFPDQIWPDLPRCSMDLVKGHSSNAVRTNILLAARNIPVSTAQTQKTVTLFFNIKNVSRLTFS